MYCRTTSYRVNFKDVRRPTENRASKFTTLYFFKICHQDYLIQNVQCENISIHNYAAFSNSSYQSMAHCATVMLLNTFKSTLSKRSPTKVVKSVGKTWKFESSSSLIFNASYVLYKGVFFVPSSNISTLDYYFTRASY